MVIGKKYTEKKTEQERLELALRFCVTAWVIVFVIWLIVATLAIIIN
jgi:hypothetical protein